MVKVKVCGITNKKDAFLCVDVGVDAVGFVFVDSKRKIEPESAKDIISSLPAFITTVGVFANERQDKILEIVRYCGLDVVQLHGEESPQYCLDLSLKVIKAFRIKEKSILKEMERYKVSGYLLDTYVEGVIGGTGRCFNWEWAAEVSSRYPIILAGGLTQENVAEAIRKVLPYAVDVSSGVEESPGRKHYHKLKAFVDEVRKTQNLWSSLSSSKKEDSCVFLSLSPYNGK